MPNSPAESGTPNTESYTNNGDGTVTDNVTKLVWERAGSTGTFSWAAAKSYCVGQRTGGYSDWRLPTQIELLSIIDYGVTGNIAMNSVFSATAGTYWTSTPDWDTNAWTVGTDGNGAVQATDEVFYARCVR
jgi:hypothetical protein